MKVGSIVRGKVVSIKPYGVFIKLDDDKLGLLHISEISNKYIKNIYNHFYLNQLISVKIISYDKENDHISLSLKQISRIEKEEIVKKLNDFTKLNENINFWINDYYKGEKNMTLDLNYVKNLPNFKDYEDRVRKINQMINNKTGEGSDFLGWTTWPKDYDKKEVERIIKKAQYIKDNYEVLVVCGIGGSYLGARAAIEALNGLKNQDKIEIIYMGQTFSSDYLYQQIEYLKNKKFAINVISKSGTTTETSVSFRILKELLESKVGKEEARKAIIATTDKEKGALKTLSNNEGYETYVLPDDIGGRYSVLTAVGLFPMAVAGIDIKKVLQGAYDAMVKFDNDDIYTNDCYKYAVCRYHQYLNNKSVELFVSYEPQFVELNEWLKQLFGESEGKDDKGLLPDSAHFSTDLHSLGQFIQEGSKVLFETVLFVKNSKHEILIPNDDENLDGLNYLTGKSLSYINEKAFLGTLEAHSKTGGVDNIVLYLDKMDEYNLGFLFYFFMRACAMSAYLLGINPFNQPGVEIYKKNMFHLLGKPGY